MKSFALIAPFAGLAFAHAQCGGTVTETATERVTVTVTPSQYAPPYAVSTPNTDSEEVKPSYTPKVPYYPIGNNGTSNYTSSAVHTPIAPTATLTESFVFFTPEVSSPAAPLSSSSTTTKKPKTIFVVPSPVDGSSPTAAAPIPNAAPVQPSPAAGNAADASANAVGSVKGTASFYGGNLDGGKCSFTGYKLPASVFGTAFGGNWDATQCGVCVSVTGPNGKTIKAMVCAMKSLLMYCN